MKKASGGVAARKRRSDAGVPRSQKKKPAPSTKAKVGAGMRKALEFLTKEKPSRTEESAFSRPAQQQQPPSCAQVRSFVIDLPALVDPPVCGCWLPEEATTTAIGPTWSHPGTWSTEVFAGISKTAAINGAKACMCGMLQSDIPEGEHRKMHISLNNGEIRIDLPLVESVPGMDLPMYTQHVYCTKCRKFEKKYLLPQKPSTPIVWSCCSL